MSTKMKDVKSFLQYISKQVESVRLDDCYINTITINGHGSFIIDDFARRKIMSILDHTCKNIVKIAIGSTYIDSGKRCQTFEQLLKSSLSLKKVILPVTTLKMFSSHAFDMIEDLTWKVSSDILDDGFNLLLANLEKLRLAILPFEKRELILRLILPRLEHIKSLILFIYNFSYVIDEVKLLWNVSDLTQLEELKMWNPDLSRGDVNFEADPVNELIKNCQNLRIVKLGSIGIGGVDVFFFSKLPKLEELGVIYKAVDKMPVLKYLIIQGLTEEQSVQFTCKVIENRLSNQNSIIVPRNLSTSNPIRIENNANLLNKVEPLRLSIEPQGRDYFDKVSKYVQSIDNCSVVDGDYNYGDLDKGAVELDNFVECACYDPSGILSPEEDSE